MTYAPYLIANYATGLEKRLQPWLIPDDAQEDLFDGYVYRGTLSKRDGYNYFAIGLRGGATYRESRIVHTFAAVAPTTGVIDGTNATFTFAGNTQIARGSVAIVGSNPVQLVRDNGENGPLNLQGDGTGTVDYLTGAITVTFTLPPAIASAVLLSYSFMPDLPVMMIANFINANNVRELIVADTQYVNRYNPTFNILEDISPASPYNGTKFDFFTWTPYANATNEPRLLFCNNVDVIQQYDGTSVIDYPYTSSDFSTLTCSWMVEMKDRLVLLRTTEDSIVYPQRIRISGTGAQCDDFDTTATGAGFIDIPDGTWITGASFNRDDLLIFTEGSTWVLKYTGNDTTPFVLDKIDESRGSDATFAVITYLNRTSAASRRGLIISDGYKVERQDESIPDFSYNEIDNENFRLCFAGSVDADRDHYLIYPPQGQVESKRILTTNYDEDNYSIYRLPLSCMGVYRTTYNITWNDLLAYPNWAALSAVYSNWNSFSYTKAEPFSVGGGHHGEIWSLGVTEAEDNPVRIRNITIIDKFTIEVTTDWNNFSLNADDAQKGADYIFLTGVEGMLEVNNQQFPIIAVTNNNVFRLAVPDSDLYTAYTSGGTAQRVIPFSCLMKKFNPYIGEDRKVRCGWLYMYVDTTGTSLNRNIQVADASNSNPCLITTILDHNLQTGDQVNMFGLGGITELNSNSYFITVLSDTTFSLNGVDSTSFGVYTTGGYASVSENAKIQIEVIVNDVAHPTQLDNLNPVPYQGNCTNITLEDGVKKWYKVFINQTGKFIQFRLKNQQAGAKINIQALMPGFQPVGRLI